MGDTITSNPLAGKQYSTLPQDPEKEALPFDEKEVAIPMNNTDKIVSPVEDVDPAVRDGTMDTSKQAIPDAPISPEVAVPANNTDKQHHNPFTDGKELSGPISPTSSTAADPASIALKFRVEKWNALGLLMPQSQQLLFRSINPADDVDLGGAFTTSKMSWFDALSGLPPPYEIYTARENTPPQLVSRVMTRGWQGITSCRAEIECWAPRPDAHPASERGKVQRSKWLIDRTLRTYKCTLTDGAGLQEFSWKGSTSAVKELQKQAKEEGREKKRVHKGNFKCVTKEGELLALWVQARSMDDLGDLYIFEAAKDKLAAEAILSSVMVPVVAERVSGMNWIGGFGKSI